MNNRENEIPKLFKLPILIAGILFVSIADLPYGFYTLMRIVVPILSAIYVFLAYEVEGKFNLMLIPNLIITVVWNPIFPVYLDKVTWSRIDLIACVGEIILSIYAYRLWKENN